MVELGARRWNIVFKIVSCIWLFMDGHPQATVVLFSLLTQSRLTTRVFKEATMGITGSACTLGIIGLDGCFNVQSCLVLALV